MLLKICVKKDLDALPFQPWDIFSTLPYDYTCPWIDVEPIFTMNTSRGCPYNCSFCSVGSIWGKQYTYFSTDRIIAEIEFLIKNFGAKGIYFREDNFTLNLKRTEEFCEKLLKKDIAIHWACETRVDNLSEKLIELMSTAGCKAFYLGVESGSQKILDNIKKQITVEQIENTINWCKKYDVRTYCSLITGLPEETYKDYLLTKKLMDKLRPYAYSFNIFVGIPDSSLYKHVLSNNLYEYIDDIGLLYLPGFDIKAKFFYGLDGKFLVDHEFKQSTDFDKKLLKEIRRIEFKKKLASCIPKSILKILKNSIYFKIGMSNQLQKIENPKVTVVMSVFNGEKYLMKAVNSILKQTYEDFEFLIINDGSSDRTKEILESYKDHRIKIINNEKNIGLTKSLNKGLNLAKGEYIARQDADDISLPRRLEIQVKFLDKKPDCALVGCAYYQINENGELGSIIKVLSKDSDIREGLKKQNWFGHGCIMMRKDAVQAVGGYDEKYKFSQDYDLWLRMAEVYKVANIEAPLFCWRSTPSGISKDKEAEQKYYANHAVSEATKRAERMMLKRNT